MHAAEGQEGIEDGDGESSSGDSDDGSTDSEEDDEALYTLVSLWCWTYTH